MSLCASIVLASVPSCGAGPHPAVQASAQPAVASPAKCPRTTVWLKESKDVARKRGIDLPEANFSVTGCEDAIAAIGKSGRARLAAELDKMLRSDRAAFERMLKDDAAKRDVRSKLNAILGKRAIDDWAADLWEMRF